MKSVCSQDCTFVGLNLHLNMKSFVHCSHVIYLRYKFLQGAQPEGQAAPAWGWNSRRGTYWTMTEYRSLWGYMTVTLPRVPPGTFHPLLVHERLERRPTADSV
jgi:hypothetical protein